VVWGEVNEDYGTSVSFHSRSTAVAHDVRETRARHHERGLDLPDDDPPPGAPTRALRKEAVNRLSERVR
jgi:hypothetical protein